MSNVEAVEKVSLPLPDLRRELSSVPFLGHALHVRRDVLAFLLEAQRRHPYACRTRLGMEDVVMAFHPEAVAHVLVKNAKNYNKDTFITKSLKTVLGNGLLSNDGDSWARQRRTLQPLFSLERARSVEGEIEGIAKQWIESLRARVRRGESVEMTIELMSVTRKMISQVVLGEDLSEHSREIDGEFEFLTAYVYSRSVNPLALPTWFPTPKNLRFLDLRRRINKIIFEFISRPHGEGESLLKRLGQVKDEDGNPLSPQVIRDEVMTLFLAGHETTAFSVAWMIKTAFDNREWAQKVYDENLVGGTVFQAFLHETYRLYSPAWSLVRRTTSADRIGPHRIEAGTLVLLSQWATHRHPEFWPDAERFDPSRFLTPPTNPLMKFAFFPFGAGPRVCVGNNLALIISRHLFFHLHRAFTIETLEPKTVRPYATTSLTMKDPLHARFKERN